MSWLLASAVQEELGSGHRAEMQALAAALQGNRTCGPGRAGDQGLLQD